MDNSLKLEFVRSVSIEKWLEFCKTNGLVHAPNIGDSGNVFVGYSIEIVLGARGPVNGIGPRSLPSEFDDLTISFSESDDKAYLLISRICDKFETANRDAIFADRIENISSKVLDYIRFSLTDFMTLSFAKVSHLEKADIQRHLNNIKGIKESWVEDLTTRTVSWKELYPSFWKRQRAKFAFNVLKMSSEQNDKPTWFMKFMGFDHVTVTEVVDQQIYDMLAVRYLTKERFSEECLRAGATKHRHLSKLKVPFSVLEAKINVVPHAPAEKINISLKLEDTGSFN